MVLRGDSVTALTWAITERPRGTIVTKAAMMWSLLCVATDINVSEVTHIAGADNGKCDSLSRRGGAARESVAQEAADMGLTSARVLSLDLEKGVMDILKLCDPSVELVTEQARVYILLDTSKRSDTGFHQ